jgi:hypothetical protein
MLYSCMRSQLLGLLLPAKQTTCRMLHITTP